MGVKALRRAGAEFYAINNLGTDTISYAFSRRGHILARFQPWLVRFTEYGLLDWWHALSELQLKMFYLTERTEANRQASQMNRETHSDYSNLTVGDLCGSYVAYVACICLVLISLTVEKVFR